MDAVLAVIGNIADILSNPWVGWALTILFAAAGVFLKVKLDGIKGVVDELVDIAREHKEATDPKSEAGEQYSDKERAEMQAEIQQLIGKLAALVKQ